MSRIFLYALIFGAGLALPRHSGHRGVNEHGKIGESKTRTHRNCDKFHHRRLGAAPGAGEPQVRPPFIFGFREFWNGPHHHRPLGSDSAHGNFHRFYPVLSPSKGLYQTAVTSETHQLPPLFRPLLTSTKRPTTIGSTTNRTPIYSALTFKPTVPSNVHTSTETVTSRPTTIEEENFPTTTESSPPSTTTTFTPHATGQDTTYYHTSPTTNYAPKDISTEHSYPQHDVTEETTKPADETPITENSSYGEVPDFTTVDPPTSTHTPEEQLILQVIPSTSGLRRASSKSPSNEEKRHETSAPNSRERHNKKWPQFWGNVQRIKFSSYNPTASQGLNPGKKYSVYKVQPTYTPYTTTNSPTTSNRPTTYFTTPEASYKGGTSVIDKLVVYMNNRLVDAVEARGPTFRRKKRSFDKTPSTVMTDYMSEALEELDEETLLDILSTLEDEYLSRAAPEEVEVIEDTFDQLRVSVVRAKAETGARFRADDEWRIKRATKKQRSEGAAAILELLTSEDEYQERTDLGLYDDEEMMYDDYYYYEDEAASETEEEPSLLELVSLASKHRGGNDER